MIIAKATEIYRFNFRVKQKLLQAVFTPFRFKVTKNELKRRRAINLKKGCLP